MVAALPDADKTTLLLRVAEGDPHVAAELARRSRGARAVEGPRRTAGELRARAGELEAGRDRADAERAEADRRRRAAEEERALRTRLEGLRARGDDVWREIETEIGRRNAAGNDLADALLKDLNALATAHGDEAGFARRLADIRARHENKRRFIERLVELGPARRSSLI